MAEVSLVAAAHNAYLNMNGIWKIDDLKANLTAFNADVAKTFPSEAGDNTAAERTVSNWLVVGTEITQQANLGAYSDVSDFNDAVMYVFKICLAADAAHTAGRISNTQATAILTAYNDHLVPSV